MTNHDHDYENDIDDDDGGGDEEVFGEIPVPIFPKPQR